jgi:predicted glycogen debranching enzyme
VSAAPLDLDAEWLEADGLGGFASGTVGGQRARRYHALLLTAATPPTGRVVLVNGLEVWVETGGQRCGLSMQKYLPGVYYPDCRRLIASFTRQPWPSWTFRLDDGSTVEQEIFVDRAACETVLRWRRKGGTGPARLLVRPLLSGRDYHALHRENQAFNFSALSHAGNVTWRAHRDLPAVAALSNGAYRHAPEWYRSFTYDAEEARGLDHVEDLASPGEFAWELGAEDCVLILRAGDGLSVEAAAHAGRLAAAERATREAAPSPLALAAESYLVDRGSGRTLLAGFPWFSDWGRDTFISMRGLMLARGRIDDAEKILTVWAGAVSEGMLPNRFTDHGEQPEFNAVDASLWYVIAVHDFLEAAQAAGRPAAASTVAALRQAVEAIIAGYERGTRYGIGVDADGLVKAGIPGVQLTWMDARVGDWVVTPRIGKPVEIQALWLNALAIAGGWTARWVGLAEKGRASFLARFSNPATGGLYDVVDVDHEPGRVDGSFRPNQLFTVGGLPQALLSGDAARGVVDLAERKLLTPLGLRTLAPDDPQYKPYFRGGVAERDSAYHQGTVWPWLIGPFIEAWVRVRGSTEAAKAEARSRFLQPLQDHLETAGLGHVSEVADGDPPHTLGGCPFQAWSLGELIRAEQLLAAAPGRPAARRAR